jgi:hypothetical protein
MLERDLAEASVRELGDEVGHGLVDRGDVTVGEWGPDQRRQDGLGHREHLRRVVSSRPSR